MCAARWPNWLNLINCLLLKLILASSELSVSAKLTVWPSSCDTSHTCKHSNIIGLYTTYLIFDQSGVTFDVTVIGLKTDCAPARHITPLPDRRSSEGLVTWGCYVYRSGVL